MRKKKLHFNDQFEFEIIVKQVQKRLNGSYEDLNATFDTDQQIGDIQLSIWNDMSDAFGFNEVVHITSEQGYLLITDYGDAYKVVNDIYRDYHGQDIDPIIMTRIYKESIAQYRKTSPIKPVVDYNAMVPEIAIPFKSLNEVANMVTQINTVYFLLARNTSLVND
ncbi:hypothetical protein ACYATM_04000 [Lactobacillaceae bacterium Scapto_B20]